MNIIFSVIGITTLVFLIYIFDFDIKFSSWLFVFLSLILYVSYEYKKPYENMDISLFILWLIALISFGFAIHKANTKKESTK